MLRNILLLVLLLFFTFDFVFSEEKQIPKIDFVFKNKIIPFRDGPIITDREIYFSQEDFVTLMKTLGFIDWQVIINRDSSNKVLDCVFISNDMPKFKTSFIPLVHDEKLYIPFGSVKDDIGVSDVFDYSKGKIYLYPQIKDISISQDSIVINSSKEIKILKNFYLNNPLRFVIDIQDCVISPDIFRQKILSSHEYIYQIRVSQFNEMPSIVRVVVELKEGQKVRSISRILPNQLQLVFSDRIPDLYAKTSSYDYSLKNEEPVKIYQITPLISANNLSILINIDKNVNYTISRLDNGKWYIDLYNTILMVSSNEIESTSDIVKSIKYSQHQSKPIPITRVVVTPRDGTKIRLKLDSISNSGKLLSFLVFENKLDTRNKSEQLIGYNKGKIIVIDPGHGGNDSGAVNRNLSLREKDINLRISLFLEEKLKKMGYNVILTRRGDYELTNSPIDSEELQARVNVAKQNRASIFVSVHINASTYSFANGIMTFYCKEIDYPLAQYIHQEMVKLNLFDDKGIRQANFYVLKYNNIPSVLLELGFITNYSDASKLMSLSNLDKLATSIAIGINNYFNKINLDY